MLERNNMTEEVRKGNEEFIKELQKEHWDEIQALPEDEYIEVECYMCKDCGSLSPEPDRWNDKYLCWGCQSENIDIWWVNFYSDGTYDY